MSMFNVVIIVVVQRTHQHNPQGFVFFQAQSSWLPSMCGEFCGSILTFLAALTNNICPVVVLFIFVLH